MPVTYDYDVTVTPALAQKWLKLNHPDNRNKKSSKIPQFARDISANRWEKTGETIKFDDEGRLIDGQNRLHAVIMADKPVVFDIVYGLSASAMRVMDSGSARTAADSLKINGAPERMRSAAIVRWVILWDAGFRLGAGGTLNPTKSEINDRYLSDVGNFDSAATRGMDCQRLGLGTGSSAGTAHYIFNRINSEQTHQFFDAYISGANLPEFHPVLTLRNRMARIRLDRITRQEQLALFVRAWNAFREDRPLSQIIIVKDGKLSSTNFPTPR